MLESADDRLAGAELLSQSAALDLRLPKLNRVRSRILNTLQKLRQGPELLLKTNDSASDPPLVVPILEAIEEIAEPTPEPESQSIEQ